MRPVIEIVEARPHHCGQMARMLREQHKSVLVGLGVDVHRELRASFDASSYRRACLADGVLAGLWGVTGTAAESSGVAWLAVAGWATKYPVAILREGRLAMEEIRRTKRVVSTLIFPSDAASFWFAKRLGFVIREDVETRFDAVLMECA